MKNSFATMFAFAVTIALTATALAQRPPRDEPGVPPANRGGGAQNNQGSPFRRWQNANQGAANQFGANQDNASQNMPTIDQLAQMMIANFDADGSGGLEQAELQSALIAVRQMMQNRNSGQFRGQANQQRIAANTQDQFQRGELDQNNPVLDGNAQARQRRGRGNGRGAGRRR